MKLAKLLRSFVSSTAVLFGGEKTITLEIPVLTSQTEINSFVKEHGRVLLGYTARRSSHPQAYDPWKIAVGKLFTELYQDRNNPSDRPKLAIAEVVQLGTGQEEPTTSLVAEAGDVCMTLSFLNQQICGLEHMGSGWIHLQGGEIQLKPAFGIPCPELPNSLVLQFQDSNDSEDDSHRRRKKMFFAPLGQNNSASEIVEFCRSEYFRSEALVNFTQGLPIWATRNQTFGLFGSYPSVSKVGALHIEVNKTMWSNTDKPSLDVTLKKLARHQLESNIGILVEHIPDGSPSTILQYERKKKEDDHIATFPLESEQQIEELYHAILQREKDGVFDEGKGPHQE